jgi:hypothetical protein
MAFFIASIGTLKSTHFIMSFSLSSPAFSSFVMATAKRRKAGAGINEERKKHKKAKEKASVFIFHV